MKVVLNEGRVYGGKAYEIGSVVDVHPDEASYLVKSGGGSEYVAPVPTPEAVKEALDSKAVEARKAVEPAKAK